MTTAREIVAGLGGRWAGSSGTARCPAHDDVKPSLSVTERDGRVLFRCYGGCEQDAVIDSLRARGLWPEARVNGDRPSAGPRVAATAAPPVPPRHPQFGEPDLVFDYFTPEGRLVGIVARWEARGERGKELRPAVPSGTGWRWAALPTPRPLYRLPDIVTHRDKPVLIVEGEKTANVAQEDLHSHIVTTWPGGASATGHVEWKSLVGRDVILWPDADAPGAKAMRDVADRLAGIARSVRIVSLPDGLPGGWDLADPWPDNLDPERLIREAPDAAAERLAALGLVTAADLVSRTFREPRWAVPGLVPEGLTILAGKPKAGKSWAVLDFAAAVAGGTAALGDIECEAGPVLYLALEDTDRRLHGRLRAVLQGAPAPASLAIATSWRRADAGGLEDLQAWLTAHPDARGVFIDTLAMIRGQAKRDAGVYRDDYEAVSAFKKLADASAVPIVLVHHLRKESTSDPLEAVSGTAGLTGSADTIIVLKREPNDPFGLLYVRGRDVIEAEHAIRFDSETGRWERLGPAADFRKSEERRALIRELIDGGAMTPRELADATGKKAGAVRVALSRMKKAGDVVQRADGRYCVPGER